MVVLPLGRPAAEGEGAIPLLLGGAVVEGRARSLLLTRAAGATEVGLLPLARALSAEALLIVLPRRVEGAEASALLAFAGAEEAAVVGLLPLALAVAVPAATAAVALPVPLTRTGVGTPEETEVVLLWGRAAPEEEEEEVAVAVVVLLLLLLSPLFGRAGTPREGEGVGTPPFGRAAEVVGMPLLGREAAAEA